MDGFVTVGGSVPGTDHTMPGLPGWKNSHDAFAIREESDRIVAVVCDGCGSGEDSEVGAKLGAAFIAKRLPELARTLSGAAALAVLEVELIEFIRATAQAIGRGVRPMTIERYCMFTIVGVLIEHDRTFLFEAGDGFYAVNGAVVRLGDLPDGTPPYLAYRITGAEDPRLVTLRVREALPTNSVESIFLGTDGVRYLIDEQNVAPFESLAPFWRDDRLFLPNRQMIQRKLNILNRDRVEKGIVRPGPLKDDTTIVVVRRMKGDAHA